MKPITITTTCSNQQEAERIATQLLNKRLAACVQISSPVTSFYWWHNKIETDQELILVLKSKKELFAQIVEEIKLIHSYDTPEIIATEIVATEPSYRKWLESELAETEI